ncbi:MAG: cytochrome c3 family protein [Polyangiaceae bacterium]|nr:cytochrome c3 family protein [Polyangiaceae bacterium]
MAALFPPWSNTAFGIAIGVALAGGAAAVLAPILYVRTPWNTRQTEPVPQPVEFDHRHHYQDDAIDCRFCHDTAFRAATAGIPSTAKCMGCHNQIWNDSPKLELVRQSWFTGEPIRWRRVHNLPDFVYFDHSIHVNKGVGCVTCHGRVDKMAAVEQVAPLTMQWCLDCHRWPERNLRPPEQIASMDWAPEGDPEAQGRRIAEELGVRKLTHCTACHR